MISIPQALDFILAKAKSFGTELLSINDAYGRVLAEDQFADRDYPPFNRSAMDGYAVLSSDFIGKTIELKLVETVLAGDVSSQKVSSGNCIKIMTGAPVPEGADAVVRVEDCSENGNTISFNVQAVKPQQNIALQAEDATKGDLLIKKDLVLNASAISVLAVTGKSKVRVYQLPEIAIVSTGSEIVSIDDAILPHQIRDSNSYAIKSLLKQYSINDVDAVLVKDDKESLKATIAESLKKDMLILSGGVSKGDADYVPEVLASLGVKEIFHRVKIKPGAPLWFGQLPGGPVVFGLPGNPVAVQVAFKVFIEPYIRKCFNLGMNQAMYLPLLQVKNKRTKFAEYFPCSLDSKDGRTGIVPNRMNGSGDISATLGSNGIAVHPENVETLNENEMIAFYPWKS